MPRSREELKLKLNNTVRTYYTICKLATKYKIYKFIRKIIISLTGVAFFSFYELIHIINVIYTILRTTNLLKRIGVESEIYLQLALNIHEV